MWDYSIVKRFHDEHYTGIIEEKHLKELKNLKFKIGLDENNKPINKEIQGWLVVINKIKYIIPQKIGDQDLRSILPIKLKETEQFTYGTNIYEKPSSEAGKGVQKYRIAGMKTMSFRDWFRTFAPFKHSNPLHWTLYKGIILGSLLIRFNYRIATNPGFGKDSLPTILYNVLPLDVGIYTPKSAPKLMTMLEKQLLIVDEIVDVKKDYLEELEVVLRIAGDMRTCVENSALQLEGMTKDKYDISNLSFGFIYNEIQDYMPPRLKVDKSNKYFDNVFTDATHQRYLPLLFKGELDVFQFKRINAMEEYPKHTENIKDWVRMTKYLVDGGFEEELKEATNYQWRNKHEIGMSTGRLNYNFTAILDIFRVLAVTEEEFNIYADELYNCFCGYIGMIQEAKRKEYV